ncbi:hypothetical protein F2Q68_00024264 [Brassica cretica]|uniref:Uncharacterized protein n=1 Tax=Brassica cretica TaxID=69181 RepID=A0A8S9IHQ0_BRACR|nr:hypothetical protein F2Q68_00024264 [Brassica cretica]
MDLDWVATFLKDYEWLIEYLKNMVKPAAALAVVLLAVALSYSQNLSLEGEMIYSVFRSFLQLSVIGFVLQFIFNQENAGWIILAYLFMVFVAGYTAGQRAKHVPRGKYVAGVSILAGTGITMFLLVVLNVFPFTPRYMIPVAGMMVGNAMTVIGVTMKQLRDDIKMQLNLLKTESWTIGKRANVTCRSQKEEALSFRLSKTTEVSQQEKDVEAELKKLEILKDDLETELQRVNTSITSVRARLRNAREEREQFDNASNEILLHLKSKEDELTRSICSCRVEADVVNKWIKFLEDTWIIQSKFDQQKEMQVSGEMERYGDHFIDLIVQLLSFYKEQLDPSIPKIRSVIENLEPNKGLDAEKKIDDKDAKPIDSRKQLEKEYLDLEAKFVTTLSVVDAMKKPFYSQTEGISRKDDKRVKELFEALDKTKEEFESIERPLLDIESPARTSSSSRSPSLKTTLDTPLSDTVPKKLADVDTPDSKKGSSEKEDLAKNQLELELDDGEELLADEINDWEFDALDDTHLKNQ